MALLMSPQLVDLPDEILLKIFSLCPKNDLLPFFTCKRAYLACILSWLADADLMVKLQPEASFPDDQFHGLRTYGYVDEVISHNSFVVTLPTLQLLIEKFPLVLQSKSLTIMNNLSQVDLEQITRLFLLVKGQSINYYSHQSLKNNELDAFFEGYYSIMEALNASNNLFHSNILLNVTGTDQCRSRITTAGVESFNLQLKSDNFNYEITVEGDSRLENLKILTRNQEAKLNLRSCDHIRLIETDTKLESFCSNYLCSNHLPNLEELSLSVSLHNSRMLNTWIFAQFYELKSLTLIMNGMKFEPFSLKKFAPNLQHLLIADCCGCSIYSSSSQVNAYNTAAAHIEAPW